MTNPFTETYMAMAVAAEEIQAMRGWNHPPEPDEFHYTPDGPLKGPGLNAHAWGQGLDDLWLPRLDQLLGMLGDFITWTGIRDFDGPLRSIGATPSKVVDWHELALAVVMQEKYKKRWNGQAWIPA